jgi:formylglycine-generating enzyme required for sulfatase activity
MGSDNGEADEAPVHEVYLDSFWMDTTEITNSMYSLCVEAGDCKPPLDTSSYTRPNYFGDPQYADYPVVHVDWSMADAYCQWAGAHLPTESQWEKAASGEDDRMFPWGDDWDVAKRKRLNFADGNNPETTSDITLNDGFRDSAPVGSFPDGSSPYGIYDMAGNVWEWVADWYDPAYYTNSPSNNPHGPDGPTPEASLRALRGGSWVAANENVFHTSNRNGLEPARSSESLGFRCAR